MLRRMIIAASAISITAVTGCMETSMWYREGVSPMKVNSDSTDCQVAAAQRVPVNSQLGQTPVYYTPVQTQCYGYGSSVSCTQTGGQSYGGNVYSYDANAGLRSRVTQQCMMNKGYQLINIRKCEDKDLKGGIRSYSVLPQLTPNSCYVNAPSGTVLVNP